jgi:hypothetical protein
LHLQSELILERLYKVLLKVVLRIRVIFCEAYATKYWLIEFGAPLPKYLETKNFWLVVINFWGQNEGLREVLEESMREVRSEKAPIKVDVPTSRGEVTVWHVRLFTSWAIDLDSARPWLVCHA